MERLKGQDGISSITQIGRAGLEAYYDDLLRGKDGGRQVEVDATGTPVKEMERKNPVPGHNFHLTIDLNLQKQPKMPWINRLPMALAHTVSP